MPTLRAIGTATPPYCLAQEQIREFASQLFRDSTLDLDALLPVFHNARIATRYLSQPLHWFRHTHSIQERCALYRSVGVDLAKRAGQAALSMAGLDARDVTHVVLVSTTGLATPTLDAPLIQALGLSPNVVRLPLWGTGCAGGAAGLARSMDLAKAYPDARILLIAVETSSLTFQANDLSRSNLVATALFADGAAAALIEGDAHAKPGLSLLSSHSTTWPDTEDVMGWQFNDQGMQVIFAPVIPSLAREHLADNLAAGLDRVGWRFDQLDSFLVHPGGVKVLWAYEVALGIPREALVHSWSVLAEFGNMSSATLLFVASRYLDGASRAQRGVLSALGPGFSSELVFFEDTREPAA